jgi:hypothetical protein
MAHALERRRPGAVARSLRPCSLTGLGATFNVSTPAQMQANVQGAANVPVSVKAQLTTAASPSAVAATESTALSGIQTVAAGGTPSSAQIQSGLALGSAAALSLASGMSMAAAMPVMIPIAIVVFGAGLAGGALIQSALGITNHGNYACQGSDRPRAPTDSNWVHATFPSLYDGATTDQANVGRPWSPATSGKFETWARPILQLAGDMVSNCMPLPGLKPLSDSAQSAMDSGNTLPAQVEGESNFALWQLALIKVWNDANPGAPMRTIAMGNYPYGDPRLLDPVQGMMWMFRRRLSQYSSQQHSGAPISIEVADPSPGPVTLQNGYKQIGGNIYRWDATRNEWMFVMTVAQANALAASVSAVITASQKPPMSTPAKVAVAGAVTVGGLFAAGSVYALFHHQALGYFWGKVFDRGVKGARGLLR